MENATKVLTPGEPGFTAALLALKTNYQVFNEQILPPKPKHNIPEQKKPLLH